MAISRCTSFVHGPPHDGNKLQQMFLTKPELNLAFPVTKRIKLESKVCKRNTLASTQVVGKIVSVVDVSFC